MSWLRTPAYDSTFQNRKEHPGSEKKRAKRIRIAKEQAAGIRSGTDSDMESGIRSGIRSGIDSGIKNGTESEIKVV